MNSIYTNHKELLEIFNYHETDESELNDKFKLKDLIDHEFICKLEKLVYAYGNSGDMVELMNFLDFVKGNYER